VVAEYAIEDCRPTRRRLPSLMLNWNGTKGSGRLWGHAPRSAHECHEPRSARRLGSYDIIRPRPTLGQISEERVPLPRRRKPR
jgi:hypothetical protein